MSSPAVHELSMTPRGHSPVDVPAAMELRAGSMWAFVELIYFRMRRAVVEAKSEIAWLKAVEKNEAALEEHMASYRAVAAAAAHFAALRSALGEIVIVLSLVNATSPTSPSAVPVVRVPEPATLFSAAEVAEVAPGRWLVGVKGE
jgi:hypothetical protein